MRSAATLSGVAAAALCLYGCSAAAPSFKPAGPRVMSIGLCADQYVLSLLPPERIASVTSLARTGSVRTAALAARVPANHQLAEEVIAQAPDIVVADAFSNPVTRAMLTRLHYRVVELARANDLAAIRAETVRIGAAIGAGSRSLALADQIDQALAHLLPLAKRPSVAAWDGSGRLPAKGSLYDAAVSAAGGHNIGRDWRGGPFGAEALLVARPDYLLHDAHVLRTAGRESELAGHPLVDRLYRHRQIIISQEALVCGTPVTIDAVVELNRKLAGR